MLQLKYLGIDGMFSYGEAYVEFKPGLILLEGRNLDEGVGVSNMSGKTALLESITTALFERNSRSELKDNLLNVIGNSDVGRIVVGGTVFGRDWEVVYQRGKEARWYLKKGNDIVEKLWNQMPGFISSEIGMSYEEFMLSSFLEQGRVNRLMEMGDVERKEIFGNWLGLSCLADARDIVKTERKKVEEVLIDLQARIRQLEEWKSKLVMTKDEAMQSLRVIENYLSSFKEVPRSEEEYVKLRKQVLESCRQYRQARQFISYYDLVLKKIEELKVKQRELESRLGLLSDDRCWVCGSVIDGSKLREEITQQLVKVKVDLESYEKYAIQLKEKVRILDVFDRKASLSSVWKMRKSIGDVDTWKSAIVKKGELVNLLRLYDQFSDQTDEMSRKIEQYRQKKEVMDFWYDGFGPQGIGVLVMDRLLSSFNMVLQQYSRWLGWNVQLELKKDKLSVLAKDRWKELKKLDWYSGSEKGLISFILCLGISQWLLMRGIGSNVLILDEVFAPFDAEMRSRLVELLKELSLKKCVIVVTHHEDVKNMVNWNDVWVVEKRNGISKLVR